METTVQRKYALSRVRAGDYLLLSNDGATLWRIAIYTEGPSSGLEDWPRDRTVWGCWFYERPVTGADAVSVEDWGYWEFWEGLYGNRRDAIDAALRADPWRRLQTQADTDRAIDTYDQAAAAKSLIT